MPRLFYFSQQQLHRFDAQKSTSVPCQAIDQYKKNLAEIKQRKKWKSQGAGAQFMGLASTDDDSDFVEIFPADAVLIEDDKLIYSAHLDMGTAIQIKSLNNVQDAEALILRKSDFTVYEMDFDAVNRRLLLSASADYDLERHLCVLALDANRTQFITEGECQDSNPCVDPQNPDQIFYDSCGISYSGDLILGPKEICKLDMNTGDLDSVLAHPQFDYFKPQLDGLGNVYFIQRPYEGGRRPDHFFGFLKNILLAPVKIIKAIVGWLDFFTQRYTGESLKRTSGHNPAKVRHKTEEELFVEGNLIKAQQTLAKNKSAGEKFPGVIPTSWALMKLTPSGELLTLKKGVMSFTIHGDVIYYSNGRHLIELAPDQTEKLLIEARLISKIILG